LGDVSLEVVIMQNLEAETTLPYEIEDAINFSIICDILVVCGWVRVVQSSMTSNTSNEVAAWVTENAKGEFKNHGLVWVFSDAVDATAFTLKWA
jgi:hypothetical protein